MPLSWPSLVLALTEWYLVARSPNVTHTFKGCRPCTMTECKTAMCDASVAPFSCLSGFAKGGCAKVLLLHK